MTTLKFHSTEPISIDVARQITLDTKEWRKNLKVGDVVVLTLIESKEKYRECLLRRYFHDDYRNKLATILEIKKCLPGCLPVSGCGSYKIINITGGPGGNIKVCGGRNGVHILQPPYLFDLKNKFMFFRYKD